VRIRPALSQDRAFVVATASRLAAFGPPPWRTADEIVSREALVLGSHFDTPADGSALLIAELPNGEPAGFVYLERLQDYFTLEPHGHVGILAVGESAAGQGAGSALMRAGEAWAREQGFRKLTLTVFEGNRGARAVYEHLGYVPETLRYVKAL
jgi:RimJ/RimL family protein N-acetyltransferase